MTRRGTVYNCKASEMCLAEASETYGDENWERLVVSGGEKKWSVDSLDRPRGACVQLPC
jgi:hypothetical protein